MKTKKNNDLKNSFHRMTALFLVATLLLSFIPIQGLFLFGNQTVKAAEVILSNPVTSDGVTTWDCIYFGNYVQSDEDGATPEPIKWRVLSVNGDDAFLLADKNLENIVYNELTETITWETCTLRTWLNGDFFDSAFSDDEQSAVLQTIVVNNNNPQYGTPGGNNTTDNVYLLSLEEAMNPDYGFTSTVAASATRIAEDTAYVRKQNSSTNGYWWLRSPGSTNINGVYAAGVYSTGFIQMMGYYVSTEVISIRPALHINLQSSDQWKYAGTVDSEGNVTNPEQSIIVGSQSGTVTYGTGGSATYTVEGNYFYDSAFSPSVEWINTIPEGITPVFNDGKTKLTLNTSAATNAGTYTFKVVSGETKSAEVVLTISKADVASITTTVENVTKTAYEARESTSKDAVIALANLPTYVDVTLNGGGTATLPITWNTSTGYNAKGTIYAVTGTLTGNDNINVGDITKSVILKVTEIYASNPEFTEISLFKDTGKSAASAENLGTDVLPTSGMIPININGGTIETVNYSIVWSGILDMTETGNNETFTGIISYSDVPEWLTMPGSTTVTRKVTIKDKIPVTISGVTVRGKVYDGTAVTEIGTPTANDGTANVTIGSYDYEWQKADGTPLTEAPKDAGSYKLVVSVPDSAAVYRGSQEIYFTINKAVITITADNKTTDAGGLIPAYTCTVTGLVSGDSLKTNPILSCTPDMNMAGTYTIIPSDAIAPDGGNYEDAITYINGTLIVKDTIKVKTPVTISGVTVRGKVYDGTAVAKSGTPVANDGATNVTLSSYDYEWQKADGTHLAEAPKDAGSYKLVVSVSDSDADYSGSQEISFTINKAVITITADNKTTDAGGLIPTYSYTVTGLVSGESLRTNPILSCTPNINMAGTYTIIPSGAEVLESGNYEDTITYINGTLTIQAVSDDFIPVINIQGVPSTAIVGTSLLLKGTVVPEDATNKTIIWTVKSKGSTGATISNGRLNTTGSGNVVITATVRNGKTRTTSYTKDFTIKVSYPITKSSTYTVSGYNYKVTSITNSKKEVTFVGLTAAKKKTATTINIKNTVKIKGITLNVTAVGAKALKGNNSVKTIKLGNNVQTIGKMAFYRCTALKSITIGTGLKTISSHVFCLDTKLKTITIKSTKLISVGTHTFHKVKATVKVPASKVASYKRIFKNKQGSLKITK